MDSILLRSLLFTVGLPVASSKCISRAVNSSSTSLAIDLTSSYETSDVIDQDFAGFAFEEASFVPYALYSNGSTNEFSVNLINQVTSRTGGKPIIRLGGTSADYADYYSNQTTPALPLAVDNDNDNVGGTSIGPSYWRLASSFASEVDGVYIVQIPLATTDVNETILWAQAALKILGSDLIQALELGNEPDWYSSSYVGSEGILGPPAWQGTLTNATYVGNWTRYAAAVADSVDLPNKTIFQAFDTAAHINDSAANLCYKLKVETCFDLGIDDGGYVKTVAHHYYQTHAGGPADLASGLMDLATTHARMDYFSCSIDFLKSDHPDIPFIIDELGSSLWSNGTTPALDEQLQYQARLGSALWQVDFYLYAMAIGVARINYQQLVVETYQPILWMPVQYLEFEPHVTANYYSQPLVADFIGDSGSTTVAKLDITPSGDNVAAYGAFEDGTAKRVAVVNLNYWNETSSGTARPSVSVDLTVPSGVTTVTVDHLSSPLGAGADADTITYGGSQWTYESVGKEVTGVRDDSQTLTVSNSAVTITVNSSSAVLVSFSDS